ncbi:hypothetical protein [Polaribacter sp. OB-PA-B3]
MRKLLYIFICSMIYSSCSKNDDGDLNPSTDSIPSAPSLVYPAQNQLCIDNTLEFKWNTSTNDDGSSVVYIFEIAADNQFSTTIVSEVQTSLSKIVTLDKGLAYYWRVKAKSSKGIESDYSNISQFYTEEIPNSNNLPFSPDNVTPFVGQNFDGINTLDLQWTASDVDNDPLKYDVYFGKNKNDLKLMLENTEQTLLTVIADSPQTTYYWQVTVKDDKGGETNSPIWNFKVNNF